METVIKTMRMFKELTFFRSATIKENKIQLTTFHTKYFSRVGGHKWPNRSALNFILLKKIT